MTNEILLRQQTGKAQGREIPLVGVIVIGRSEDVDLVLEDERASRRHAELRPDGDHWQIVDLGATNKTFLNDAALKPNAPTSLHDGDVIRIGNTEFCFVAAQSIAPIPEANEPPTQVVPLKSALVVGRDSTCDIVLDEPQVSPQSSF